MWRYLSAQCRIEEWKCQECNKRCVSKSAQTIMKHRDMKQPQYRPGWRGRNGREWGRGGGERMSQRSAKTADEKKGRDGIRTTRKQIVI